MAFLRNNTVNLLNVHYGIAALASHGGGAFFRVFLLKSGISAPIVLVVVALILIGRFVLRPLVLVAAKRFGLKPVVIFGTLVSALQYPCLASVQGIDGWLAALIVTSAIGDTFYWTSYHAYFASLGDPEHRGHQVSAREALAALVGIAAPLIAGWALATLGAQIAFGVSAGVQVLAALPLFATPSVAIAANAPGAYRAALTGVLLFVADGWICAGYLFVWEISLFLSLGESFSAFGGAMALAAAIGAAAGMVLGRYIDAGHGSRAALLAFAALAFTILMRAVSVTPLIADRQRARRARRLSPRAGGDDRGLQFGKALALCLAFPCGDRRCVGRGLRRRELIRSGSHRAWRAARIRHFAVTRRRRGCTRLAATLLFDARR